MISMDLAALLDGCEIGWRRAVSVCCLIIAALVMQPSAGSSVSAFGSTMISGSQNDLELFF